MTASPHTHTHTRLTTVAGSAAALSLPNVDTDQIMPKQFLKGIDREGLAEGFLHDMRFDATGQRRAEFVLNQAPWVDAKFLVTGPNFGCGSSREHAVWGMRQLGIRCVMGTSFGGIFSDNCLRNGVLALVLPDTDVARLTRLAQDPLRCLMHLDLQAQTVHTAGDNQTLRFELNPLHKDMLLLGLDAVGMSLTHAQDIRNFETRYLAAHPWVQAQT